MKITLRRSIAATSLVAMTMASSAAPMPAAMVNAARLTVTDYGFSGLAFGTYATADLAALRSSRTALAIIGCTRVAGSSSLRSVAAADTPSENQMLAIGAVDSATNSYRNAETGRVGTLSTTRVASVRFGETTGPRVVLKGLVTRSHAYANANGSLGASSSFTSSDIIFATGNAELDNLFSQPDDAFAELQTLLAENGGGYVIPGLGSLHLGSKFRRVGATSAGADAIALVVHLYGADGAAGGGDDTRVTVGRARARIDKNMTSGVFRGYAHGFQATLLDSVLRVGPLGERRLGCQGTQGRVITDAAAGVDVGNAGAIRVDGASATVYGQQFEDGSAKGWTRGRVARIAFGTGESRTVIEDVVGRVNVHRTAAGAVRTALTGTDVGSVTIGGEEQPTPEPGETIEVPGVALLQFFVVQRPNRRAVHVSAVKITMLDETPGVETILLGNAWVAYKPY